MSEMETHKGKLIPMVLEGVTLEERCEAACKELGIEMAEYNDTWEESLRDEGYKKVYISDRVIYKIDDTEVDSYGFVEGNKNDDGTIDYFISWYNGGGSMDEVLDSVIKKVNKDD
jgi:hypothetical protein